MKFKKYILIFSLLTACEEAIDVPSRAEEDGILIVEGVLTSEPNHRPVKLYHSFTNSGGTPVPASGAIVLIAEGSSNYPLIESPGGSGLYYPPDSLRATAGKRYILFIQYQGSVYAATDSAVAVENLEAIRYSKDQDEYLLDFFQSGKNPNYVHHAISWASTGACVTESCEADIVFYDLKGIDVNELFKPSKEDVHFPLNSTVIRTKYSLSAPYRDFLRAVLSETEWRGGVFDVDRTNVPTNLSEGAKGFFAVSTVVSDTTVIVE